MPVGSSCAASYVIDGFTLNQAVRRNPSFRSYACHSSFFEGVTECNRTRSQNTSLGSGKLSTTIMHTEDGTAVYLSTMLAPVTLSKDTIRTEIANLSGICKSLKGKPTDKGRVVREPD